MSSFSDVTLILPTLNEEKSISVLLNDLISLYPGIIIIVADDDSTDGTQEIVQRFTNPPIHLLNRQGAEEKGLTASILDAVQRVRTTYFIVMDADGQHPPRIVSSIFSKLASGYDIVIASRETVEPEWPLLRRGISHLGSILGKVSLAVRGVSVWQHDILSGFFGVRTEFWQEMVEKASGSHFRRAGYKCLFDFLKLIGRDTNIAAVPYIFATRKADSSKICWRICAEYIRAILS